MNLYKRDYGTVAGPHPPRLRKQDLRCSAQVATPSMPPSPAAFAEGVVEPSHNGIAGYGGCVLIYRKKTRDVIAVDYNSAAPAAASEDMFTIEDAPGHSRWVSGPGTRKRSRSAVHWRAGSRRWLVLGVGGVWHAATCRYSSPCY